MFENKKCLKYLCSLGHFIQGFVGGFLLIGYPWLVNMIGITLYTRLLLGPCYCTLVTIIKRYIYCKNIFGIQVIS